MGKGDTLTFVGHCRLYIFGRIQTTLRVSRACGRAPQKKPQYSASYVLQAHRRAGTRIANTAIAAPTPNKTLNLAIVQKLEKMALWLDFSGRRI